MVGPSQTVKTSRGYVTVSSKPSSTGFSTPAPSPKITSGGGGVTTSPSSPQTQTKTQTIITQASAPTKPVQVGQPILTPKPQAQQQEQAKTFTGFQSVVPYQAPATKMPTYSTQQVQQQFTPVVPYDTGSKASQPVRRFTEEERQAAIAKLSPRLQEAVRDTKTQQTEIERIRPQALPGSIPTTKELRGEQPSFVRPPSAGFTEARRPTKYTRIQEIAQTEKQLASIQQRQKELREGAPSRFIGETHFLGFGTSYGTEQKAALEHPYLATAFVAPAVIAAIPGAGAELTLVGLRAAGVLSKTPAALKSAEIGVQVARKVGGTLLTGASLIGLGSNVYGVATAPAGQRIQRAEELSIPAALNVAGTAVGAKIAGIETTVIAGYKGIVYGKQPLIGVQAREGIVSIGTPKIDLGKGLPLEGSRVTTRADVTILEKNLPSATERQRLTLGVQAAEELKYTQSKFISGDLPKETKTLSEKGVITVLKFASEEKVKLFGSYPTQPQLPVGVRRTPGDIDLTLKGIRDEETAIAKTKALATRLKVVGEDVRISKENPTLIETSKGEHVVDIKYEGQATTPEQGPESKGYLFGIRIERPSIKFPTQFGKVEAATLAEQGLRKGESVFILRPGTKITQEAGLVKEGEIGFSPADHRIEKDIKDYFIVQEALAQSRGTKTAIDTVAKLKATYPESFFKAPQGAREEKLLALFEEPSPLRFKQTVTVGGIPRAELIERPKEAKVIESRRPSELPSAKENLMPRFRPSVARTYGVESTRFTIAPEAPSYTYTSGARGSPPSIPSPPSETPSPPSIYQPPSYYPQSPKPPSIPSFPSPSPSSYYYELIQTPPIIPIIPPFIPSGGYGEGGRGPESLSTPQRGYAPSLLAQVYNIRGVAPGGSLTGLEAIRPIEEAQQGVQLYRTVGKGKIATTSVSLKDLKIMRPIKPSESLIPKMKRGRPKGSTRQKQPMFGGL